MESSSATTGDEVSTSTTFNQSEFAPSDEELRLQALNRSKDKLLSIVGHDLRTSIGGVLTLAHMLEKRLDAGDLEEAKRLTGLIRRTALDADDLLKDLFAWTRKSGHDQHFRLESIDISELIQSEIERLKGIAQQKQQRIKLQTERTGIIRADAYMLRSVFRNLLTNALKFSRPGECITVRITRQAGLWEFQVSDNGIGMSDDVQELLLKVDERKQRPGTAGESGSGFGLLLCEDFIQRHGGHLSWESTPGKGSTFTFTIPELLG